MFHKFIFMFIPYWLRALRSNSEIITTFLVFVKLLSWTNGQITAGAFLLFNLSRDVEIFV